MFPLIVVGTYEEFVLGYTPKNNDENNRYKLHQTFATHSHQASVRCMASSGQLMASSGADEYINIYDMIAMEVSTVINYHNSTVTCLEFTPDDTHLVTANQNGDIAIFRCKDWTLVKLWKETHKNANGVTSTSIHPSGSLLISTGADNIVRFWNLVKGRQAYAINFSKKCSVGNSLNFGVWSKNGSYYVVGIGNKIEVYKTETAAVVYEITTSSRTTCAVFTKKNLLCIGTDEGNIEVYSIAEKKLLCKLDAHKTRIKCITYFPINFQKNDKNKLENYIVCGDSKGCIKLWYLKRKGQSYSLEIKGEVTCDCRITCMSLVLPKNIKEEKSDNPETLNFIESNMNENLQEHLEKNCSENDVSYLKKKARKRKISTEKETESNYLEARQLVKTSKKIKISKIAAAKKSKKDIKKIHTFTKTDIVKQRKTLKKFQKKKLKKKQGNKVSASSNN